MHTFVTGSTGAGKSNTTYRLLDQLDRHDVRFLVIEPAKGEYRQVLGGRRDVRVLGTNPKHAELLQINPFAFPDGIHVLEHIDRLIEIFNACWPMYAAMPAVLKEAVEQVYVDAGWDLDDSVNYSGGDQFPGFAQLLSVLSQVIRRSEYSEEVKSNYTGALVTRVRSLTNGINGKIFNAAETDNGILFDRNCIVDLSRIGSAETRALIMGILVMRLQEHRSAGSEGMNSRLKHVTVLEEAHQLLRRTSSEQSQEGANLQGKAVEMLSSAIAEMRTYGEGFIIADQSPSLLDLSVIRNTNTKIVLRLPDEADRQLVGRASNLNDEQIVELAKLKVGVAAVYQNNWLQPILCAVEAFTEARPFTYSPPALSPAQADRIKLGSLTQLLLASRLKGELRLDGAELDLEALMQELERQGRLRSPELEQLLDNLRQWKQDGEMALWKQDQFETLARILSALYEGRSLLTSAANATDFAEWNELVVRQIRRRAELRADAALEAAVIQCLLREQSLESEESRSYYFNWVEQTQGRGIV